MGVNEWIELKIPNAAPKTTTANSWIELHLPNAKTLGRFLAWGLGRIAFSVGLFGLQGTTATLKLGIIVFQSIEGGLKNLLKVYDALPYGGAPLTQVQKIFATHQKYVGAQGLAPLPINRPRR
jgi:hypothetical protein